MKYFELYQKYTETANILRKDFNYYHTELKRKDLKTTTENEYYINEYYIEGTRLNIEGDPLNPLEVNKWNEFEIKTTIINVPMEALDFKDAIQFFERFKIKFDVYKFENKIHVQTDQDRGYSNFSFSMTFDENFNYLEYACFE